MSGRDYDDLGLSFADRHPIASALIILAFVAWAIYGSFVVFNA